jgi:outer membrane protein TolC
MALTNAERQARWRQRRKDRTQRLEAEINDLKQQLAQAQHEIEVLRAQLDEAIARKPSPKRGGDPLARFLYPSAMVPPHEEGLKLACLALASRAGEVS